MLLGLRLYGINWDEGYHLHPDERMLIMVAQRIDFFSQLDPDFFNYGSLPVYVLSGTAELLDLLFGTSFDTYGGMLYLGRVISTLADMVVLVMVGLLTRELFKKNGEIVLSAMTIYALLFFPIQNSNFFIVDTFLVMFLSILYWLFILILKKPTMKLLLLAGIIYGAALATKVTPIILLPLLIGIVGFRLNKRRSWFVGVWIWLKKTMVFGLGGIIAFVLSMPYALLHWERFIADISLQVKMNADAYVFPYTLQYVGTTPYLYHLKQIFWWGAGPLSTVLAFVGIVFLVRSLNIFRFRGWKVCQFQTFFYVLITSLYFLVVGRSAVKFMRYMLPLYPALAIFAGYGVTKITSYLPKKYLQIIMKVMLFSLLLLWTVGFLQIYTKPHTRVEASAWMLENIPPNAVLAIEHWDDRLPLVGSDRYKYEELELYNLPDSKQKWQKIESQLSRSDYVVLASNRLYTPLQKLDDCDRYSKCYPKTAEYYSNLFAETHGFRKIAEFSSYPRMLGFDLVDDAADESFTVYDHPRVIIFEKK